MNQRVTYYPIPFIVLHPLRPVSINTLLPGYIKKITGIKVVHSTGIERMTTQLYLPVIGHLSLEFNNRKYHLGNIDVPFDNSPSASDEYLDAGIDVTTSALLTGNYENKVFTGADYVDDNGNAGPGWKGYIVTVYLKTLCND